MKKLATPALLALSVALTGCLSESVYYDTGEEQLEFMEDEDWVDYGNLDLIDGELRGDIGDVRGIDQSARLRNGYGDSTYASVEAILSATK